MMKALVVTTATVDALNEELKAGWMVSHTCGMSSSVSSGVSESLGTVIVPTCLVILYKNEPMSRTEGSHV